MDEQRAEKKSYKSLFRKVVLIILFTAITPTLVVSIFILDEFRISYRQKVYDHLTLLARKHKKNIDMFLDEKLMDIRMLASTNSFKELSNQSSLNKKFVELQRAFDRVFVDIGVVNHEGRQIAYAGPYGLSGAIYTDTQWFKKAITSTYFISDVFKGLRGEPHFIVTVKHEHEGRPWILRATIDFGEFNNLVEYLRIGKTGFAFILNQDGQFQTNPIADVKPDELIQYLKNNNLLERPQSISKMENDGGNEVLYAVTMLKNGEWMMVLQQDYKDAFTEFNNTQKIAFLIIIIGSLGIIACTLILSHQLIRRISLADEEKQTVAEEKEIMSQQVIETGKLASIGELAAGIAHEINNPVAIMIEEAGWVQDLLEEEEFRQSENLKELYRALKQINTQGKRCKEITHKLLSFARKTDSRIADVFVNSLLDEIVYLSSQRAKYGNIEIHTQFEDDLPPIAASETEMQQVFLNLVNNALDAMEKTGGKLTLTAKRRDDDIIVAVADSGHGIAAGNLSRVFDPFYTTKPVGKGTGLGLSICYGIVKKIGGDIIVNSEKGQGTTFEIRLPINQGQDTPDEAAESAGGQLPLSATIEL